MTEKEVVLTLVSTQRFKDCAPETSKLVTQGTLRVLDGAVELSYAETELTGLNGTTTSFRIEPERIILSRSGALTSRMVFVPGEEDCSLYDMGFGALMIAVRTEEMESNLGENGGKLRVRYGIAVENETAGEIEYRMTVRPKKK